MRIYCSDCVTYPSALRCSQATFVPSPPPPPLAWCCAREQGGGPSGTTEVFIGCFTSDQTTDNGRKYCTDCTITWTSYLCTGNGLDIDMFDSPPPPPSPAPLPPPPLPVYVSSIPNAYAWVPPAECAVSNVAPLTYRIAFTVAGSADALRAQVQAALASAMAQYEAAIGGGALCEAGDAGAFTQELVDFS